MHSLRPRTLPGPHHAARFDIPDALLEELDAERVPGWFVSSSADARAWGDRWLEEARTPALAVPALPSRPVGRVVLINPVHPAASRIGRGASFAVPWDERLF